MRLNTINSIASWKKYESWILAKDGKVPLTHSLSSEHFSVCQKINGGERGYAVEWTRKVQKSKGRILAVWKTIRTIFCQFRLQKWNNLSATWKNDLGCFDQLLRKRKKRFSGKWMDFVWKKRRRYKRGHIGHWILLWSFVIEYNCSET